MPLQPQTEIVLPEILLPNAIYIPHIEIRTDIVDGDIKTSVALMLKTANADEYGVWKTVPEAKIGYYFIENIMNLEEELSSLSPQILQMFGGIVNIVNAVNSIKKIL